VRHRKGIAEEKTGRSERGTNVKRATEREPVGLKGRRQIKCDEGDGSKQRSNE